MITAKDLQASMLRYIGGDNSEQSVIDCRSSIDQALLELWGKHDWPWYISNHAIILSEPYSTGTIAYNATTRRFTLTSGTWPTWVEYGVIVVGTKYARITDRISDTVIEIEDGSQFTATIAAGSTYKVYRDEYPLPSNVRKVSYLTCDNRQQHVARYMPPLEFSTRRAGTYATSPTCFTIQKDRRSGFGLNLVIWPFPTTTTTIRFPYIRSPQTVTTWSYTTGKITTVAASASITGLDTVFDETHVGAVLRVGRDGTNIPTPSYGNSPALQESLIDAYGSATSITTKDAIDYSKTGVKYEISSLIDIDPVVMSRVFEQQCYLILAEKFNKEGREYSTILGAYNKALLNAINKTKTTSRITYAGQPSRRAAYGWTEV